MISRFERNKDSIQDAVESTATHVGRIATIITTAVVDVTREIGELITDGIEMREASKRAEADGGRDVHALADDLDTDEDPDEDALDDDPRPAGVAELESAERPALPSGPDAAVSSER